MLCGLFGIVLITHAASLAGAFPMQLGFSSALHDSAAVVQLLSSSDEAFSV